MTYYERLINEVVKDISEHYTIDDVYEDEIRESVYDNIWFIIRTDEDAINVMNEMGWSRSWRDLITDPDDWDCINSLVDVMGFAMEEYFMTDGNGIDEVLRRLN